MAKPKRPLSGGSRVRRRYLSGAFDPASLPGMVLWLDSDSGVYQEAAGTTVSTVGDPLGLVRDRSGQANHASQATSTKRPTRNSDGMGWDVTDDALQLASAIALTGAFTVYVVGRRASSTFIPLAHLTGDGALMIFSDNNVYFINDANTAPGVAYTGAAATALFRFRRDASDNMSFAATGMANVGFVTQSGTITLNHVGQRPGRANVNGNAANRAAQILIYNRFLTADEDAHVRGYLLTAEGVAL